MRKFISLSLALVLILSLCACSKKDDDDKQRECGVYITIEADDVYTVSCGTDDGSDSFKNADDTAIAPGTVAHFDFAGDKAEGTEKALIEYSICIYDNDLDILAVKSFADDFSNLARVDITVTADHKIINANAGSCGGDVVVEMTTKSAEDNVWYMSPTVFMPDRSETADIINDDLAAVSDSYTGDTYAANHAKYTQNTSDDSVKDASAFSMRRTIRTERADSGIVSFRVVDRASLGTYDTLDISGLSYDSQTGKQLTLSDLGSSESKIVSTVSEKILVSFNEDEQYDGVFFNEGYSDTIKSLVSDGNWYLSAEGIVIIADPGVLADTEAGFYEFTVPYDELDGVINSDYIPTEDKDGSSEGEVTVEFAADASISELTLLGSMPNTEIASLIVSASGSIYNVSVYTIEYYAQTSTYNLVKEVLTCSDMSDTAALAVNMELDSTTPTMVVRYALADGTAQERLLSLDENGAVKVTDPLGSIGTDITSRLPYEGDIGGDSKAETISTSTDSEGLVVVSVTAGGSTYDIKTGIRELNSIRLFDLDGDDAREIYIDGADASGASITCVVFYSPEDAQPLHLALFDSQSYAAGLIKEFDDGKLVLDTKLSILGTYNVKSVYTLSDKSFSRESGDIVFDNAPYVTTSKSMTLANGSVLRSGTTLRFTSTDGSSVINFVTDGGFTGAIAIAHTDSGWTIGGQPDTSYFTSLPYEN